MDKRFKGQPAAVTIGFLAAVLLLFGIMLASELGLTALEKRTVPLIDEAIAAAMEGDTETANRLSAQIDSTLREAEPALMLIANHRDLMDMLDASNKAVLLGETGERDSCIEALSSVRTVLRLLLENNDLTFGNIL